MRTVIEVAEAVRRGEQKAMEVLDECLDAIDKGNERLNAFVHLDVDQAREAADAVDAKVARGEDPGPFAGVPFGVKDIVDTYDMPTVRRIVADAAKQQYRFSSLVRGIVHSVPFQMRVKPAAAAETETARR